VSVTQHMDPVFERIFNEVFGTAFASREPRYRYFIRSQPGPGHESMYCWTTERMSDGTFRAFIYRPQGKGARKGHASEWRLVKESKFKQRKTAKAQARRWYERGA